MVKEAVEEDQAGVAVEIFKKMTLKMTKKKKDSEVKFAQLNIDVKMMMKIELNLY